MSPVWGAPAKPGLWGQPLSCAQGPAQSVFRTWAHVNFSFRRQHGAAQERAGEDIKQRLWSRNVTNILKAPQPRGPSSKEPRFSLKMIKNRQTFMRHNSQHLTGAASIPGQGDTALRPLSTGWRRTGGASAQQAGHPPWPREHLGTDLLLSCLVF